MIFADRRDAGRQLGSRLRHRVGEDAVVIGLARGGVRVAAEVAAALGLPLEVVVARKVGAPSNPEYAIGAIAEGGPTVVSQHEARVLGVSPEELRQLIREQQTEIERQQLAYRGTVVLPTVRGKIVVLVDDGIATGLTMRAAVESVRGRGARSVVVAVPVGPQETLEAFRRIVDDVVVVATPSPFFAVGSFYARFEQVTDEEVRACLEEARIRMAGGAKSPRQPTSTGD